MLQESKSKSTLQGLVLLIALFFLNPSLFAGERPMGKVVDEALKFSVKQSMEMYEVLLPQGELLPRSAVGDSLVTCKSNWWTSGFYPGTLWYLYEYSRDNKVKKAAEIITQRINDEQYNTRSHDVGFMINCSYGNGYRLTQREEYRQVLVNAANSLATRFSPQVGSIRSWNSRKFQYSVIIDNMMNLELLCNAARLCGDKSLEVKAISHADNSCRDHIRPNGSSFQVVSYDSVTGSLINQITHQGYADSTTWSRGQAWALYGFSMMYRETGNKKYFDKAAQIAAYIMNHPKLPEDKIPYWDFDAPAIPNTPRDASAGAIMASAFVEMSTFFNNELGRRYLQFAEQQIRSLASPSYRAKLGRNANFILMHSVSFMAKNSEVDAPLNYADYYFVEAMMRWKKVEQINTAK